MKNTDIFSFIWLFVAGGIGVFVICLHYSRSKRVLQKWADSNKFEILHFGTRYFTTGQFKWWQVSNRQHLYFVRVRDAAGRERSGWVRCGSFFGGVIFSDEVEVRWNQV
jgi:hypothetical protein